MQHELQLYRGNDERISQPSWTCYTEEVKGTLPFIKINGFVGLGDITGHPVENIIKRQL
jgi:hypothetical protein